MSFYRELPNGRIHHRAEPAMLALALLVIPAIVLEVSRDDVLRTLAFGLNVLIWTAFAAELAFVLRVASHWPRTLRAHWLDAMIVVTSFPFLPGPLRGALLLRLLRLVRLLAYGGRAATAARYLFSPTGFRYVALLAGLLVLVGGAAVASVETEEITSIEDGLWWALATVTTVGYGDEYPTTPAGRLIASGVMLLGIGFFAVLTATVAASFVKQDEKPDELHARLDELDARLERIESALTQR